MAPITNDGRHTNPHKDKATCFSKPDKQVAFYLYYFFFISNL